MRRLKKILKRLALVCGILLALALIANAIWVWQTGQRLEARLSKLRAAGEPITLPDLGAMPPAPGKDAAAVLWGAEPEMKALIKEIAPVQSVNWIRTLKDADWKKLETAFTNHPTVLPALFEAASCTGYQSPLNYHATTQQFIEQLLPHIQTQRDFTHILGTYARIQMRKTDRDGTTRTCLSSLRLSTLADREPMMISHLVALATRTVAVDVLNEVLRAGPLTPELHKELDSELARHDTAAAFRHALQTERPFGLQAFDEQLPGGWFGRAYVNSEKCYYLDMLGEWIAQADGSFAQFRELEQSFKATSAGPQHMLSRMLLPAIFKVREATFRSRCQVRCLRVLNALVARNVTEVPAKLTDLGLPAAAVTDPFTDRPLIVKRIDGQWVIYGLGPNQQDDGGKLEKNEDIGYGPVKKDK